MADNKEVKSLLDAGVHFGHLTRKWNPNMAPYIYMERNGIHIINLYKASEAKMPYITERWPGGMLTNFVTIRRAVKKMASIDRMKQDGTFNTLSKKERLQVDRLRAKLEKNLGSISDMSRLPGALFIVDTTREHIAVKEAQKLNIPIFAMVDTNSDPREIDYAIPSNDDASKSIEKVVGKVSEAIIEGLAERKAGKEKSEEEKAAKKAKKEAKKEKEAKEKKADKKEVPSKDKEDKKAMKEAKKPVKLESKEETLEKATKEEE
jgi:small subunit ribosomal protein S2